MGVFTTSFTYSQSNPWVNCDFQSVLNRVKNTMNPANSTSSYTLGNLQGTATSSSNPKDTCIFIDLTGKCPLLDSNAIVVVCFDDNGVAEYSVLKTIHQFTNGGSSTNQGISVINSSDYIGGFSTIRDLFNSSNYIFYGDTVALIDASLSYDITTNPLTFTEFQFHISEEFFSVPLINFVGKCDTCVARIIGIGIGEKNGLNDSLGNPLFPCIVHCDSFHAGPIGPPPPGGTLGQGPLTAHAAGNGFVTYKWSFAGSPLSGSGPNCPNIDMTAIPGGGVICVTVTNWLPNGDSCSCVMCIGLCYNICQPTKMAGHYFSPDFQLYPSPAKDKINLSLHATVDDIALLTVVSKEGKEISKVFYPIAKGVNKYEIDLKTLATGQYYISVQSKSFKEQRSFLKE